MGFGRTSVVGLCLIFLACPQVPPAGQMKEENVETKRNEKRKKQN